ncbi:MAG: isoprenylcysteine carboxylmethyltransferase family protein [Deltaproteobacteria bacterium]|nr:isoprenylcysteine carboxylmethyltransferase family protein [Deltaproteobacteria bacterium]
MTSDLGLNRDGRRRIRQIGVMVVVIALTLFLSAGRLDWPEAWVFLILYVGSVLVGGTWMVRRHPEVVNERGRSDSSTKPFDRVFAPFYASVGLAQYVVAGLDARFFGSAVPLWARVLGSVGLVVSMASVFWAMAHNPFLATTVRIRSDQGHRVATTGPYRIVRHPMYAGNLLFSWTPAFCLGSWWALLPTLVSALLLILRTRLEDRALLRELPGYADYARTVPHRLVPGLW